jgi:hypothetical protein
MEKVKKIEKTKKLSFVLEPHLAREQKVVNQLESFFFPF